MTKEIKKYYIYFMVVIALMAFMSFTVAIFFESSKFGLFGGLCYGVLVIGMFGSIAVFDI